MATKKLQDGNVIIKVTILGMTPIMMNPANDAVLDSLPGSGISKAARRPRNDEETADEIAARRVIKGPGGKIGLPVEYLYGSLKQAGKFVIFDGKKKVTDGKGKTLLFSFLTIEEMFLPFKDQRVPYVVDRRRGVLENSGKSTAVCVVRPRFDSWAIDCTIEVDPTDFHIDKVRQLFDQAGKKIGIGDFRNGPFGRFKVAEWKVMGERLSAAA